jgi:prophage tail gpP-like protein
MYKETPKTSSWEDISRKEYGTPLQADNLKRLNNNKEYGNVIVYDDKRNLNNANLTFNPQHSTFNNIELFVNNNPITEYIQIDLLHSIQDIRSAVAYTHRIDDINIFDYCAIIQNNKPFLQGYVKNITPILNANDNHYVIQIKSVVGILLDTAVSLELEFVNSNLREIIENVCNVYNIKVTFTDNNTINYKINNEIETSASAKLNENIWSFITRLCNSRGLLVRDTGTNEIRIGIIDNTKPKLSIICSQTSVANWLPIYNYDSLARYYEVYSQFNTNSKELVTLEQIKLPITKRIASNEINEGILKNYANWIVGREIGKAVKLQIEFLNNTTNNSNANNMNVGDLISVRNNLIGFSEPTDLIVEKIITNYPHRTTMILTLPCAYSGKMPNKLPLL